jgi:hypothetical protein
VADRLPPELTGKGKRVAGVFVFMIGASIILDTHAVWVGLPILTVGLILFGWGMVAARTAEPLAAPQPGTIEERRR